MVAVSLKKKGIARASAFEEQLRDIKVRLQEYEERATTAERSVAKLTKDQDRLEGKLFLSFQYSLIIRYYFHMYKINDSLRLCSEKIYMIFVIIFVIIF